MALGNSHVKALVGVGIGLGATVASGVYYWLKSRRQNTPPKTWKLVGTLSEIYYYPVKSCSGIKLHSAECGILGIRHDNYKDRMFMVIDENNVMVSARAYPKMLKIQPNVSEEKMIVTAPEMDDLEIDFSEIGNGEMVKSKLWGQDVFVVECGKKYEKWFSKFILNAENGIRLVYYSYPVPTKQIVEKIFKNGIFRNEDTGALHDVSSYMLMNNKSIDDLNLKLKRNVTAYQFRPNLIINTNGQPYNEDNWKWIKIGKTAIFRNLSPCYRCTLPNIDPISAERDPDGEPLKTLKSYRLCSGYKSPGMGRQLAIRVPGLVCTGDDVFVEESW